MATVQGHPPGGTSLPTRMQLDTPEIFSTLMPSPVGETQGAPSLYGARASPLLSPVGLLNSPILFRKFTTPTTPPPPPPPPLGCVSRVMTSNSLRFIPRSVTTRKITPPQPPKQIGSLTSGKVETKGDFTAPEPPKDFEPSRQIMYKSDHSYELIDASQANCVELDNQKPTFYTDPRGAERSDAEIAVIAASIQAAINSAAEAKKKQDGAEREILKNARAQYIVQARTPNAPTLEGGGPNNELNITDSTTGTKSGAPKVDSAIGSPESTRKAPLSSTAKLTTGKRKIEGNTQGGPSTRRLKWSEGGNAPEVNRYAPHESTKMRSTISDSKALSPTAAPVSNCAGNACPDSTVKRDSGTTNSSTCDSGILLYKRKMSNVEDSNFPKRTRFEPLSEALESTTSRERADRAEKAKKALYAIKSRQMKGFPNTSNWCYRNAGLQLLMAYQPLCRDLVAHAEAHKAKAAKCVPCAIGRIGQNHLCDENSTSVNGAIRLEQEFRKSGALDAPFRKWSPRQDDSGLYVLSVVAKARDHLHFPIKAKWSEDEKSRRPPILDDAISKNLFGLTNSVMTCGKCKHRSVMTHDLPSLTVQPQKPRENRVLYLEDSIDAYFKGEVIKDYRCENCKQMGKVRKSYEWVKVPPYLIVDIPRWDREAGMFGRRVGGNKSRQAIQYPKELSFEESGKDVKYQLKALVAHQGATMDLGHYVAYVKAPGGAWKLCNDESVRDASWAEVATCRRNAFQATVFAYERIVN